MQASNHTRSPVNTITTRRIKSPSNTSVALAPVLKSPAFPLYALFDRRSSGPSPTFSRGEEAPFDRDKDLYRAFPDRQNFTSKPITYISTCRLRECTTNRCLISIEYGMPTKTKRCFYLATVTIPTPMACILRNSYLESAKKIHGKELIMMLLEAPQF
jgi:hypothetical protein